MSDKRDKKMAAKSRALVRDIEDLVDGGKWSLDSKEAARWKRDPWAGAGIVVCESLPVEQHPSYTYVASPYVVELSWLIENLKTACSDFIDASNKDAFYGRLADAANRYLSQRSFSQHNPKDLCFAVLREATRIVEDFDNGQLSSIRNEVCIKRIWVQLHPAATRDGAGLAVYWVSTPFETNLVDETFSFKGKSYRIGKSDSIMPAENQVMHIAVYHEI